MENISKEDEYWLNEIRTGRKTVPYVLQVIEKSGYSKFAKGNPKVVKQIISEEGLGLNEAQRYKAREDAEKYTKDTYGINRYGFNPDNPEDFNKAMDAFVTWKRSPAGTPEPKLKEIKIETKGSANRLTPWQDKETFWQLDEGTKKQSEKIVQPKLSKLDEEALKWAKQNPKDPRAIKIQKKLGM